MLKELGNAIKKTLITIQGETIRNVHPARGINIITGGLLSATERPPLFTQLKGVYAVDIEYAKFVHDGTRFMKARPFLQNAVNTEQELTDKFFSEAVNNVLSKIGKDTK
ncbi:MAG: hypothetical protein EPO02_13600 [Nitrospirae bacterium]|nr:MAG: hypothetical protein EPO02_13600 [Nitrospirota bacterium]